MGKVLALSEAIHVAKQLKSAGKSVVLVGGCFDMLHRGHLAFLERAKNVGDVLFVALENDENVKRLKGTDRPAHAQQERTKTLANLPFIDYVILLPTFTNDSDYFQFTMSLSPNIIAITYGDPKRREKEKQAKAVGGDVVAVIKRLTSYSTTDMLTHK